MDLEKIRSDFPILRKKINGYSLIYFDNAATSLTPVQVYEAVMDYYKNYSANVGRGLHTLAREVTERFESARSKVAEFINARYPDEIVFVRNATEGINLVSYSWARDRLSSNDKIVTTVMEHHSNLLPWLKIHREKNVELRVVPITSDGHIDLHYLEKEIKDAKLVAVVHASNVLGTINNVREIAKMVHEYGGYILVDGAQSTPHLRIDVRELDCDFFVFSGHKMLGPTGIGVLYVRKEIMEEMKEFQVGGGMISDVSCTLNSCEVKWASPPHMFEAGTPHIAGAFGLIAAIEYLQNISMNDVRDHELKLLKEMIGLLSEVPGVNILGPKEPRERTGLVAFTVKGFDPHEIALLLDQRGIAIRSGHHCALPLHKFLGMDGSARASFYIYNSVEEVETFIKELKKIVGLGF